MAAARIAAVLLFALAPVAFAQQFPQSVVTVQVNDVTGAPVPGAQVDLTPPCGDPTGGETDGQGGISLDAAPGLWNTILTVTSPGFCPESRTVGILNRPSQIIPIEMQIGVSQQVHAVLHDGRICRSGESCSPRPVGSGPNRPSSNGHEWGSFPRCAR
jgi:hypothetical protein